MMHFDLTDLSLFRHVAEAGSITRGAERAHLALAAASTRIRNMENSLGAALLVRSRQGVTPTQAGRTLLAHARADPAPVRAAARRTWFLRGRPRRSYPGAFQHERTHRIPARGVELVSCHPSACERRHPGAAQRRDRRHDRRRRGRPRHRRQHRRYERARDLPVPAGSVRAGGRGATIRWRSATRSPSPRCSTTTSSASTGRARCSASSPTRRRRSGRRCACAFSSAALTRCAGWSNARSGSGSCRKRRRAGLRRPWRSGPCS